MNEINIAMTLERRLQLASALLNEVCWVKNSFLFNVNQMPQATFPEVQQQLCKDHTVAEYTEEALTTWDDSLGWH